MKIVFNAWVLVLTLSAGNAWANRGDQYVLGKLGFMSVKKNNADAVGSIGALYGYGLTPDISLESELNLGLFGGKYTQKNTTGLIEKGDYRISTLAGYGVYRLLLTDVTYLKGKLGVLYENVKRTGELLAIKHRGVLAWREAWVWAHALRMR